MNQGFEPMFDRCEEQFGVLSKDEFEEQESDKPTVFVETENSRDEYHALGLTSICDTDKIMVFCFDYVELDEDGLQEIADEEGLDLDEPEVQQELEELRGELLMMLREQVPFHNVNRIGFTEAMDKMFK